MKALIHRVTGVVEQKLLRITHRFDPKGKFLIGTTSNGSMVTSATVSWTAGFTPGVMWQLHSLTKKQNWSSKAQLWQAGLANQQKTMWPQHDFGERERG
jgi:hypothetical protein